MTIAGFYLSPEGVVLGADSTSSVPGENGMHYFDFNQKVFEIGEESTFALTTWGLGGLGTMSYRTLIALLADNLKVVPPVSVLDVAQRWIERFWSEYSTYGWVRLVRQLHPKRRYDPAVQTLDPEARTEEEESLYTNLKASLVVGFCIAGHVEADRQSKAAHMVFEPLADKPIPVSQDQESWQWWGVPNIINRLVVGADHNLVRDILQSGHWSGTIDDLNQVVDAQRLSHASLPLRDAIDYVYSSIHCTIKAMKFSNMSQVCGGPIEIAVISSDRKFRWVRHKTWDAAITDGGL